MQLKCQALPYHGDFLIVARDNAPYSSSLCVGACVLTHLYQSTTAEIKAMSHSETYRDTFMSHSPFLSICLNQPDVHNVQNVQYRPGLMFKILALGLCFSRLGWLGNI